MPFSDDQHPSQCVLKQKYFFFFEPQSLNISFQEPMGLFEMGSLRTDEKQATHTMEAVKLVEFDMKQMLMIIVEHLCGEGVEMQWVDAYFPFTHPSWELEVKFGGEFMELLGCGIMEQDVLVKGGYCLL